MSKPYNTHKRIELLVHESTAECLNRYVQAADAKAADNLDTFRVHLLLLDIANKCDAAFSEEPDAA